MSTDMSSVNNTSRIEVITGVQRRRRWTPEQKLELVKQTFEAGMTVSMVARQAGIAATQLFQWKKAYSEGSLVAVGANNQALQDSISVNKIMIFSTRAYKLRLVLIDRRSTFFNLLECQVRIANP